MGRILTPHFNSPLDPRKTQGLVAFYSPYHQQAGSGLYDLSGNGNNGILYNSPTWQNGDSICGNNTNQYIDTNLNTYNKVSFPFTIVARMAIDTLTTGRVLLAWRLSPSYSYSWSIGSSYINLTRDGALQGIARTSIVSGRLYNLAVVYNSDISINAYLDGVDATTSGDDYWTHTITNMLIGARNSGSGAALFSDFRFQKLAIYNRGMSADEVRDHMDPNYLFAQRKIYGFVPASGGGSGMFHFLRNSMNRGYM